MIAIGIAVGILPVAASSGETLRDYPIPSHGATVPVARTDAPWLARQEAINTASAANTYDILFIGDSITELWGSWYHGRAVWNTYYATRRVGNLGAAGDWTQHILWRLQNGNLEGQQPRLAVIMAGGNNNAMQHSHQEIAEGVLAMAKEIYVRSPATQILILGVFPRGAAANHSSRERILGINSFLEGYARFQNVTYLDLSGQFLEPDGDLIPGITTDTVHLSGAGHRAWAEGMENHLVGLAHSKSTASILRSGGGMTISCLGLQGFSYRLQSLQGTSGWLDGEMVELDVGGEVDFWTPASELRGIFRIQFIGK